MPEQTLPFVVVVVVLTVVPGPDMALGLRNGVRGGSTAMWWTGLGASTGLTVHAAASVVGLSALLAASATAYTVVKYVGAAYLIWLGIAAWRQARAVRGEQVPDGSPDPEPDDTPPPTRRAAFGQGLVSNVLNPKIALLFLTLLPQFVSSGESRVLTSVVLTLLFVAIAVVWWRLASWAVGGLQRWLAVPRVRAALERVTAAVLVGLGARVALERT